MDTRNGQTTDAEPRADRQRRKFVAGALEQAAQILGAVAASVLVAGLVGPYIAALTGGSRASGDILGGVAAAALAVAGVSAATAIVLRGLSRRANDDVVGTPSPPSMPG